MSVVRGERPERFPILHCVNSFETGGTERHFTNLLRKHDRDQFDLHVACLRREGAFLSDIEALGCPIVEYAVTSLRKPHALWHQVRLARYLRQHRIQLVSSYGFYGNFFAIPAAWIARVPVIVASIRDIGASWSPAQQRAQRWSCRLADSVLVNADAVKKQLSADGYRPDRIKVLRNGIDVSSFSSPELRSTLREEFSIPEDAALIGAISRIERVKGLESFVDAAAVIARRTSKAWFVIVGDAHPQPHHQAYKASLRERVEAHGLADRFIFAGFRDDVPGVLKELAVSVLPSLSEGFPNAALESMAAGVCVVATAIGGTPEIVEDSTTGLLVPPGDSSALAEAVQRLLENPDLAERLAEAGRLRVASDFSLAEMTRATERHYLDLLQKRSRGPVSRSGRNSGNGPRGSGVHREVDRESSSMREKI